MKLMFLKIIAVVAILLLRSFVIHVFNRMYLKKIKVLEELLDSRLHCTFGILRPTVDICGKYKDRIVSFTSYTDHIGRCSIFILTSAKLPKQKKLMINYPKVSQNVHQKGDTLQYWVFDLFTSKIATLGKAGVGAILDELVATAEKSEGSYKSP
jgi:hypothetical protein